MDMTWKDKIFSQRKELAQLLQDPFKQVAWQVVPAWPEREHIENTLVKHIHSIPYCHSLYVVDTHGTQVCETISPDGIVTGHFGRDRSQRPYMKEVVPTWGFLLSDGYISEFRHRPSLTALHILRNDDKVLGYIGADFDLRNLPASTELYQEPGDWRQIKGDPAIRSQLFQQTHVESPMDRQLSQAMIILEEMITQRGVFQAQIHFSSSQATIWLTSDPYRYRILDIDALTDPDICMLYPRQAYPADALIAKDGIEPILTTFEQLRHADENIYLRVASINLFNGMVSVTFSCDGSHYMPYDEFLQKNTAFWFGEAA